MTEDNISQVMTIEKLQLKIENQANLIKELSNENEEFYHQFNHLMIRNGKLLKRIDDLQRMIDELHLRIEELQLINGNMMQINDRLRVKGDNRFVSNDYIMRHNDNINTISNNVAAHNLDIELLTERWRNFPGQTAQNGPNLKKQVLMLVNLYSSSALKSDELFQLSGVGGVTGARYVSVLKKFGMIRFTGARKKGSYEITRAGKDFIENAGMLNKQIPVNPLEIVDNPLPNGIPLRQEVQAGSFGQNGL
jgi:predicted transcriptional regulator